MGIQKIARIVGMECINVKFLNTLNNMTKDGQWRVRMSVFELLAELGLIFGKADFQKHIQVIFLGYLQNTAALVRQTGVKKSALLADEFKDSWIVNDFIPAVNEQYRVDKKGYNYRICCLNSLAAMMPFLDKG